MKTCIIDSGFANVFSVQNACKSLGSDVDIVTDPMHLDAYNAYILAGVGSFHNVHSHLKDKGFWQPLQNISPDKKLLGICLGMQLLFLDSDEGGHATGLGLITGHIKKIINVSKLPHMGWNTLHIDQNDSILHNIQNGDSVYFVHSYMAYDVPTKDLLASTHYEGAIIPAIVKNDNIYGTQFHPEKSGPIGLTILKNFLSLAS